MKPTFDGELETPHYRHGIPCWEGGEILEKEGILYRHMNSKSFNLSSNE